MNKYRIVISVLVGISFAVVGVTGILIKFVFKSHAMNEIHTWVGMVMVVMAVLHLLVNWKPFAGYFRNRRLYLLAIPFVVYLLVQGLQKDEGRRGPNFIQKIFQAKAGDVAAVYGKSPDQALASLREAGLKADGTNETIQQISEQNHRRAEDVLNLMAQ